MLKKIISGGQTGADLAGLVAGRELKLQTGGMMPKGFRTEDGYKRWMADEFGMTEHQSWRYPPRTEANVIDSDGTAIFGNANSLGCNLTIELCKKRGRPYIVNPTASLLKEWIALHNIIVLNVAGNRESTNRGIYRRTLDLLIEAFKG